MALGSSGRSLSSAGTSLSLAGNSLRLDWYLPGSGDSVAQIAADRANGLLARGASEMGMHFEYGGLDLASSSVRVGGSGIPRPGSYEDMLYQEAHRRGFNPNNPFDDTNAWMYRPLAEQSRDLASALYGPLWSDRPYRIRYDPTGSFGRDSGGEYVASLLDDQPNWLRQLKANGIGGLQALLAQPFNVVLRWGAGAYDLDLHMTGPLGEATMNRFHIYYAARGTQIAAPFAELIKDCICRSGSEVILTSTIQRGGVYRISVFNYGDDRATSSNLSTASQAQISIVRGGTAVSQGDGTTIVGGREIYTGTVPTSGAGNTWVAAEIDPRNGRITAPNVITQSQGSDNVP